MRARNRRKLERTPRPESPNRSTAPEPEHPVRPKDERQPHEPWKPPTWEPADAAAFKALQRGTATPEQQKRALEYVIHVAAGTYDWPFRPEGERDTLIALGRQFVGKQIVFLVNVNESKFTRSGNDARPES